MRTALSIIWTSVVCIILPLSCQKNTGEPEPQTDIPNIIFDTDMGNSTDDVFAMQAMFAARSVGCCNVVGVIGSRKLEKAKKLLDCFMHYYHADDIPLGFAEGDEQYFEIIPYYQLVDSLKADGTPLFEPTGIPLSERLPGWKLYRKLLSEAEDASISIVCVGMFTNLGNLLDSQADEFSPLSGKELVRKKVKSLEVMGGCFSPVPLRYTKSGTVCRFLEVEYNIGGDIPLAKKVIQEWPVKLCMFPLEEGLHFPSVHDNILKDYRWQPESPIYQIYSHYDEWASGDVGQYLWDAITMIHAIDYFKVFLDTTPGFIQIDDDGRTTFTDDPEGNAIIISMNKTSEMNIWDGLELISQYSPNE